MVRLAEAHGDVIMNTQPQLPTWAQVITGEGRGNGASRHYRQGQYDYDLLQIRNLTLEDSFAQRIIDALVLHAVRGSGTQVDFGSDKANRRFSKEWGWNSKKPADRKIDLERQIVRGFARDGEDFRLWRYGGGLYLDWVNPNRIDRDSGIWKGRSQGGIRFDQHWRPERYEITAPSVEGYYAAMPDMSVPAYMMIHTYRQDFDDQVRGISWIRPCLRALRELTQYTDNVAEALDVMVRMPSYILLSEEFDEVEIGGEKSSDLLKRSLRVDPKQRFALPPGAELRTLDTPQMLTGTQIQDVVRFYAGRSARGASLGSQVLSTSTGQANMSEIQAEEAQDELVYQRAQQLLMGAMEPIAREWAQVAMMLDPSLRIDPREIELSLPRASSLNYRDRQVALKEVESNVRSRSAMMREAGEDPETVWAEMEADAKRIQRIRRIEQGGDDAEGMPDRGPGKDGGQPGAAA